MNTAVLFVSILFSMLLAATADLSNAGTFTERDFKYGSIGTDSRFALPYRLWSVLPKVCPGKLPNRGADGYENFGWIFEPGEPLPVGLSMTAHRGTGRTVGINCASCHTSTYRVSASSPRIMVLGMPAHRLDLIAYGGFITDCLTDETQSTRDNLVSAWEKHFEKQDRSKFVAKNGPASAALWDAENIAWKSTLAAGLPLLRYQLKDLKARLDRFMTSAHPPSGFGRDDSPNPYKVLYWNKQAIPEKESIGNVEFTSIWNAGLRGEMPNHWDGSEVDRIDRNLTVVLGAGANAQTLPLVRSYFRSRIPNLEALEKWRDHLAPPAYPTQINQGLSALGANVYRQNCASCHGTTQERLGGFKAKEKHTRLGTIISAEEVGTDPYRLWALSPNLVTGLNDLVDYIRNPNAVSAYASRLPGPLNFVNKLGFQTYRKANAVKTNGYVATFLEGIFLRGPYLHNGSVPTLADLLTLPDQRPVLFYRGSDILDHDRVGFLSEKNELEMRGQNVSALQLFDTRLPGNGNAGHQWGTQLSMAEKNALLEYLKTF